MNTKEILGKIKGSDSSKIKIADTNPCLAKAASLASGFFGINNKLKLDVTETIGNNKVIKKMEILPKNLIAATENMANSNIAKQLFGDAFVEHFSKTCKWEWRQFASQITNCELKRYFEII